jgi:hypothetical protein
MHEGIKESRLVPLENAGHGFFYEEKEKLNTELVNFISILETAKILSRVMRMNDPNFSMLSKKNQEIFLTVFYIT